MAELAPRRRWQAEDAKTALTVAERSGMSLSAFARQLGVQPQRLYRWRRQLSEAPRAEVALGMFMEVPPGQVAEARRGRMDGGSFAVEVASGRVVWVPPGFDAGVLRRLLDVVDEPRGAAC
jgi:transposase-like protein